MSTTDQTIDFTVIEQNLRAARAELQRRTGERYCSISIEGDGKIRVYVHQAGTHDCENLQAAIESAVVAAAPKERAARLRHEAEERLQAAAKLEETLA